MNALPVVARDLRLGSRRSQTWWARCVCATVALVLLLLLYSATESSPAMRGRIMFNGVGVFMLVLALLSGVFLTADTISAERRGGTLGLLFLTPLRPVDVILGKLASSSLSMLYGLLAVFPLLFLALLVGGVTGGEAARLCLAILVALLLSLAVGLQVSVHASDSTRSAMATLSVLSLLALLPLLVEMIGWTWFGVQLHTHPLMGISPAYSFKYSGNAFRTGLTGDVFWRALAMQFALGIVLIASACRSLRLHWRQDATSVGAITKPRRARPVARRTRLAGCSNPYRWLMERQMTGSGWSRAFRALVFMVWLIVVGGMMLGSQLNFAPLLMTALVTVFVLHTLLGLELAFEATRPLQEQHQSGALEQVLTSPLPPGWIIAGTIAALNRRFSLAGCFVFASNLAVLLVVAIRRNVYHFDEDEVALLSAFLIGGGTMSLANLAALRWIGMMRALIDRTPLRAALRTLLIVHALPWLFFALVFLMISGPSSKQTVITVFWTYYFGAIAFAVWLGHRSRQHVTRYFKQLVTAGH